MVSFRSTSFSTMAATTVLLLLSIIFCSFTTTCEARKSRDLPHHHSGLLQAYEPGPFTTIKLDKADEETLKNGKPVMKQNKGDGDDGVGGGAICVQDVNAPKEAVWSQILDLESYKGKVPKVNESKNYAVQENPDGTCTIKTKMVLGVLPGYSYTSFYNHRYNPTEDSMTWTLDYDKTSDMDDVSGHWHLEDHPEKPDCTRVFYACDIKLKGGVPKPVVNILSKSALRTATGWVKKESEKTPTGKIPSYLPSLAF